MAELAETGEASSVSGLDPSDRRLILRQTLEAIRAEFQPNTWQAFWQVTIDGQSAADVAQELGITANAVRQAKFRVLRRLRQKIAEVD